MKLTLHQRVRLRRAIREGVRKARRREGISGEQYLEIGNHLGVAQREVAAAWDIALEARDAIAATQLQRIQTQILDVKAHVGGAVP